jgi:hypothetical protein
VTPLLSRKELAEPGARGAALVASLVSHGQMTGSVRIPDTIGPLVITADLRAGRVTCYVDVEAPREGRPSTRVNWLMRQLRDAPDAVRVEAFVAHGRGSSAAELLREVRANPAVLVTEPTKELRSFRVAVSMALGTKRGRGRGSFIDSVLECVDRFYEDVVQNLRAWTATPPKLRADADKALVDEQDVAPGLVSTALSSQDGAADDASVATLQETQESPSADHSAYELLEPIDEWIDPSADLGPESPVEQQPEVSAEPVDGLDPAATEEGRDSGRESVSAEPQV